MKKAACEIRKRPLKVEAAGGKIYLKIGIATPCG